jgi:hypothetical protein
MSLAFFVISACKLLSYNCLWISRSHNKLKFDILIKNFEMILKFLKLQLTLRNTCNISDHITVNCKCNYRSNQMYRQQKTDNICILSHAPLFTYVPTPYILFLTICISTTVACRYSIFLQDLIYRPTVSKPVKTVSQWTFYSECGHPVLSYQQNQTVHNYTR